MGVKDKWTPEGKAFMKNLKELAELEVAIGFQAGTATEDNGADVCDVAAWNELGTSNMPSRPFLRNSVDLHVSQINGYMQGMKEKIMSGVAPRQILNEVGLFQKDLVQEEITSGNYAPNAPSTIRKKGSSHPLIDSGRMRQSVNYVVRKKGSGE